ncbi:hypothetical protein DEU56DRAFT_826617 [Suillus clintonianus]|uniref:uncharacterized protein n=1 Tax=Suillus clintonianus TaxID=1904413 RepID=UPI001B875DFC|nr:uncharacterized protein DEU56DRAFT_826617 [Suillus clintonianus]KAG2124807.1 hypothetical protein DEU56DRAFT_826617 [Suillus clintonianus]
MNTRNQNRAIESSENWDDDFEFQQSNEPNTLSKHQAPPEPRLSVASSAFTEDWDTEGTQQNIKYSSSAVLGDRKNYPAPALEEWAEPGPSTPTRRSTTQTENWDDDFEDRTDFPAKRHPHAYTLKTRHSYHTPPRLKSASDPENWDDDFETDKADTTPMTKRTRQEAYPDSSDDEAELGFTDKDDDRTVTARSRSQLVLRQSPPPPVPPLPLSFLTPVEPFPRSPTVSVFSIPTTSGRNSVGYTSTSHLALRPSVSGGSLAMLPPSPPIHRERRRLRKKSRPPHIENNVFELIEEQRDSSPTLPPSTPERPSTSPLPQSDTGSTGPQKTPLLSRIGSVKKWGVRKKRASTGPAEVMMHELRHEDQEYTPRPTSSLASVPSPSTRPSWFFRSGGPPGSGSPPPPHAAELKHEKSMSDVHSSVLSTPHKLSKRKSSKIFDPNSSNEVMGTPVKPSLLSAARRPTSMQVPQGKVISASTGTRHTSYGSSMGRAASKTFSHPDESVEDLQPREGNRGFMGGMRKISLVSGKKHKRKKSAIEVTPLPSVPMSPPPLLPDEPEHPDQLLPPIELQPPSPPRTLNGVTASHSAPINISQGIESLFVPSSSAPASLSPKTSPVSASRTSPGKASSPQSASLGRTTQVPPPSLSSASVPRRNSLGDLKIPARISQAQISLKRDLGMVREFAASVDKLKELQAIHHHLVAEVHTVLESSPLSRAASPPMNHLTRPRSRLRSNTEPKSNFSDHKHLAATLNAITTKYKLPWECAELLIELGGGTPSPASPPSSSTSAPAAQADIDLRKSRERAVTLSGDESKLPSGFVASPGTGQSNLSWRSTSGRHDLTQRQLVLLRDILNSTDGALPDDALILEETHVNRQWRWGDAMSSTVTLPSEESMHTSQDGKKRRHSRMGMSGLRDMLRSLKRSHSGHPPPPLPASTTSLSTQSSMGSQSQHHYPHAHLPQSQPQRRSKTSAGPESMRYTRDVPNSPYNGQSLKHKASPRRPSLASIFRLGQKNKNASSGATSSLDSTHSSRCASRGSATTEEEDWDQIDSVTDLDGAARALGIEGSSTIKGKKGLSPYLDHPRDMRPMTPNRVACSSQTSLKREPSPRAIRPMRSTRLSNVEEVVDDRQARSNSRAQHRVSLPRTSPSRPPSRNYKLAMSGSVRSAPPPQPDGGDASASLFSEFKLAMTPENIKPLLDNAKEVHLRLNECIREVRALLDVSANHLPPS